MFPAYGIVQSEDAFHSKLELPEDLRRMADEVERAIASDPEMYRSLAKGMGLGGDVLVYEHPGSPLEVTFQIDKTKERVIYFRYTQRQLRLRKTIFISYSHKDSIWLQHLREVFQILERLGEISFWDDELIPAAADWKATLEEKLDSANGAILLVSDSFLESDFIKKFELPRILEEKKKAVYWIHLSKSKVAEKEPRITRFQSLSSDPDITLADLVRLGDKDLNAELLRIAGALAQAINPH